jgi:hypothetical protein
MTDFETGAELSVTVSDASLRSVRETIESELSDVEIGVSADVAAGGEGGTEAGGREQRRRRREFRWARQRTQFAETQTELLQSIADDIDDMGGGGGGLLGIGGAGGGGGGGGLIGRIATLGGGAGLGAGAGALGGIGAGTAAAGGVGAIGLAGAANFATAGTAERAGIVTGTPGAATTGRRIDRATGGDIGPLIGAAESFITTGLDDAFMGISPPEFPEPPSPPDFPEFPEPPSPEQLFGDPLTLQPQDLPFGDPVQFGPEDLPFDLPNIQVQDIIGDFDLERAIRQSIDVSPEIAIELALDAIELSAEIDDLQREAEREIGKRVDEATKDIEDRIRQNLEGR